MWTEVGQAVLHHRKHLLTGGGRVPLSVGRDIGTRRTGRRQRLQAELRGVALLQGEANLKADRTSREVGQGRGGSQEQVEGKGQVR